MRKTTFAELADYARERKKVFKGVDFWIPAAPGEKNFGSKTQ